MKNFAFAMVGTLVASFAFAGEKAVVQAPKAACDCQKVATKTVVVRPVELKVVEVKTIKAVEVKEVCATNACQREGLLARARARRADRRSTAVVCVECPEAAAAAKK
jgi:hypothetical protein